MRKHFRVIGEQRVWIQCVPLLIGLLPLSLLSQESEFPKKTGVQTPGVLHAMQDLRHSATFPVQGDPDWLAVTADAVWVTSDDVDHVVKLDPKANRPGTIVTIHKPCSGMTVSFGSLWVPSCGDHDLIRLNQSTGAIQAVIPAEPADSEGGITAGAGSVWLVTSGGELSRVDPTTNRVSARILIPSGSFNPLFANGTVWITSNAGNVLLRVDPSTNQVAGSIPVGPRPRFLTAGAGSIWVLNQGDGSISRVDAKTWKLLATIQAGIPGHGGEIAFGGGFVWATVTEFPLTQIDPRTNKVIGQWRGEGGDSVRFGFGTLWLTDLRGSKVWRIPVEGR